MSEFVLFLYLKATNLEFSLTRTSETKKDLLRRVILKIEAFRKEPLKSLGYDKIAESTTSVRHTQYNFSNFNFSGEFGS